MIALVTTEQFPFDQATNNVAENDVPLLNLGRLGRRNRNTVVAQRLHVAPDRTSSRARRRFGERPEVEIPKKTSPAAPTAFN